jgi:outer membrane protein assembly factor BamB
LWAIDPENGSLKWNIYVTLKARASPAIGADDTIYYATAYGHIYAVNSDGTVKWVYAGNYNDDGHFFSSSAIGNGSITCFSRIVYHETKFT